MKKEQSDIAEKVDRRKIVESLIKDGQVLLPFIDLICNAEQAIDELIDVTGRAAIEADKGKKKLNQLAKWLELEHPSASGSLLEGLGEMFTLPLPWHDQHHRFSPQRYAQPLRPCEELEGSQNGYSLVSGVTA